MALETPIYISDLVPANPTSSDPKSQGDDHIRNIKSVLKTSFPQISGPVTATHTQLSYAAGVTGPIQAQIDARLRIADAVTKEYVDNLSFSSTLPALAGNAGKVISNDGSTSGWADWAAFNDAFAPDVATSATPDIWSGVGKTKLLTGNTAVTGFTAAPRAGAMRKLIAATGFYMINGANLAIKGGSITLAAGDEVDVLALTTTTFRATVTRADGTSTVEKIVHYDSGTSGALNLANGRSQRWAPPSGAKSLTIAGWAPAGVLDILFIEGVNLFAGSTAPTWNGIKWVRYDGGFAATLEPIGITLQTSGTDFLMLWTRDGGVNVYGKVMR